MSETTPSEATIATPPPDSDDEMSLECLSTGPAITRVRFDEQGDLNLLVGADGAEDQALYTVCSRTLSRTSTVFDAMLRRSKADRQLVDDDWTVRLPFDDPQSIRIILNIAHGRFRDVPVSMALGTLHQLCVCLDKYNIAECLGPWAKEWCRAAQSGNQQTVEDNARIAWVAYVLGNKRMFQDHTKNLFLKTSPSSLTPKINDEHLLPLHALGILDKMMNMQIESMQLLVDLMHDTWSDCIKKCPRRSGSLTHWGQDANQKTCAAAIAGSLTACLHDRGLLPSSKPIPLREYVLADIVRVAEDIVGEIAPGAAPLVLGPRYHHNWYEADRDECGPSKEMLEGIKTATEFFVPELDMVHCEHFKEQAKRIGVEY